MHIFLSTCHHLLFVRLLRCALCERGVGLDMHNMSCAGVRMCQYLRRYTRRCMLYGQTTLKVRMFIKDNYNL